MFEKKIQVIKFEQNHCHAKVTDNNVLYVRVKDDVKDKNAMFEVPHSHRAYVYKGGMPGRLYESGSYRVFDDRSEVKLWKKGFSIDIIYIPKETRVPVNWGTSSQIEYRDSASNQVIHIGARGNFEITVTNPEQFSRRVIGASEEFDLEAFQSRFSAMVVNEFADCFLKVVGEKNLTYDQFDANRGTIGTEIESVLNRKFRSEYGIELVNFIIEGFKISEAEKKAIEDAAAESKRQEKLKEAEAKKQEKIKEYLATLERLDDKQWERDKYLRQLELEDRAAYYEVLKVIGSRDAGEKRDRTPKRAGLYCPHCGQSLTSKNIFCQKCGERIVKETLACPHCGRANDSDASFCAICGYKLK